MPPSKFRDDIKVIGMPLTEICNQQYTDARQRQLFKNIIYVGALSALLDMDIAAIETLIGEQFKGKDKLIQPNVHALHMGRDYALEHLSCPIGLRMRRADAVGDRIFIEGNAPRRWARSMAAPRSAPGTRSRRPPRWPRPSPGIAGAIASTRRAARTASPSSRPRTSSPRSAW